MRYVLVTILVTISRPAAAFGQSFNLSSAECFNPKEVSAINLFNEWSAYEVDGSDGYCYDNHDIGYERGQDYTSCGGCLKYNCSTLPCNDRDGSKFKTFWVLDSVSTQCCQDCEGKIFPPNEVVSTTSLEDKCDTMEHATCKTSSDVSAGPVGTIEVSYTSGNCCLDETAWSPAGTTILEKDTCSERTCRKGRPAQWDRHTKYQGDCGCCMYKSAMLLPGECRTLNDGRQACCCDGEMVVNIEQKPQTTTTFITTPTTTFITTPTTTFITTPKSSCSFTSLFETNSAFTSSSSSASGVIIPLPTTTTTTTEFITLPNCKIEALSFALDISGSMKGSMNIWKFVADKLVDEMVRRRVSIDQYYLFTYVDTIDPAITTQDPQDFINTIANWTSFSGSQELTFTALKHAMEQVNSNAFVCIWTDEIGDDTNNATLKADILSLKASTNSEIFFMAVTRGTTRTHIPTTTATSMRTVGDASEEDGPKRRAGLNIGNFEQKFNDIGHVLDITNDPNVISKMITIMQQSAICNPSTTTPTITFKKKN